jgi:hypothetical protein
MPVNPNHIIIEFNKLISMGRAPRKGLHISAAGNDIETKHIESSGGMFIRLQPKVCEAVVKTINGAFMVINHKQYIIDVNDVVLIKEEETGLMLWDNTVIKSIIIELTARRRLGPQIVKKAIGEDLMIDIFSFINASWVESWSILFIKLKRNVSVKIAGDWLEIICGKEKSAIETLHVLAVYEKGGIVIWRNPVP